MMGRYRGLGGPSTAELLDMSGQVSITQLLSRHRVRWLGHAARKPEATMVNQLLYADSIPGRPRPVGHPPPLHVDGWGGHAGPQHPRAPATATTGPPPRLAEVGAGPGRVEGGCQPVLALSVLYTPAYLVLVLVIRFLAVP